jgi:gamma-glutamyltranspeptidase/glutathione hydrolase
MKLMIRFTVTQSRLARRGQDGRRGKVGSTIGQLCRFVGIVGLSAVVAACQVRTEATQIEVPQGAVSDHVNVTNVGLDILQAGGGAADAAAAMALAATVHTPDLAGLGGGGSCLVYDPGTSGPARSIDFPATGSPGGAAVPALVRGIQLMHARAGNLRWAQVAAPAETAVRLREADSGRPSDLAEVLAAIRTGASAAFYNGEVARRFAEGAQAAGYPVSLDAIRAYAPQEGDAPLVSRGNELVALGPGIDGRAEQLAAALTSGQPASGASAPSFNLAAYAADGSVAVCGLTMNRRGGTGTVADGTGITIAPAAPDGGAAPAALAIRYNRFIGVALDAIAVSDSPAALAPLIGQRLEEPQAGVEAVRAASAPVAGIFCGVDETRIGRCLAAPSNRPAATGQVFAAPNPEAEGVIGVF